jgi:hypothetical protein
MKHDRTLFKIFSMSAMISETRASDPVENHRSKSRVLAKFATTASLAATLMSTGALAQQPPKIILEPFGIGEAEGIERPRGIRSRSGGDRCVTGLSSRQTEFRKFDLVPGGHGEIDFAVIWKGNGSGCPQGQTLQRHVELSGGFSERITVVCPEGNICGFDNADRKNADSSSILTTAAAAKLTVEQVAAQVAAEQAAAAALAAELAAELAANTRPPVPPIGGPGGESLPFASAKVVRDTNLFCSLPSS